MGMSWETVFIGFIFGIGFWVANFLVGIILKR